MGFSAVFRCRAAWLSVGADLGQNHVISKGRISWRENLLYSLVADGRWQLSIRDRGKPLAGLYPRGARRHASILLKALPLRVA